MHELTWTIVYSNEKNNTQECTCPHCGLKVAGIIHCFIEREIFPSKNDKLYSILECPSCGKPIIYQINEALTFPSGLVLRNVKNLPNAIDTIYREVNTAIGSGCYTAAVGLARTAINHIAVDKGADENKNFQYYVQYMVDNHFVPPNAHNWVDKIRIMANESVHDLRIWKCNDAVTIGQFLMYLLIFVYELPSSVT